MVHLEHLWWFVELERQNLHNITYGDTQNASQFTNNNSLTKLIEELSNSIERKYIKGKLEFSVKS